MYLVKFDTYLEMYQSYPIDSTEVDGEVLYPSTTKKRQTFPVKQRQEKVVRYETMLGGRKTSGIMAICESPERGKEMIKAFLAGERRRARQLEEVNG